jgi:23S rRNA pseudouridine1911/1915/1917 synthase
VGRTAWSITVTRDLAGDRLDHALKLSCPGMSLRQVRRFWDLGRVLVDGRACGKGYRLAAGERITVTLASPEQARETAPEFRVVAEQNSWAALNKPSRIHTERRLGESGSSLEDCLGRLFPGREPILLNRLDYLTSGLVMVAMDHQAAARYAELQDRGLVEKTYLVLVQGIVKQETVIRLAIDSARRKKVAVRRAASPDRLRWTDVSPLKSDVFLHQTLLQARIRKGSRHQIRAHLAAIGHPIVGDPVYGCSEAPFLHLHHQEVAFPGFHAFQAPEGWSWT